MKFLVLLLLSGSALAAGRIQNEDVKSQSDIQSSAGTITGNLTSGNACISSPSSTAGLATGLYIYDSTSPTKISAGTTIAGLPGTCSAGQIQMSANATASATGDTITFGGQLSQLVNDTKIYVSANSLNETLNSAITNGDIPGAATTSTISSTAIDWSVLKTKGGLYTKTLSANTTFTWSNVSAGQTIVVALTNTASNYTVTWPAAAKWSGGTAPTQTTGAHTDVYTCISYDGTNAYCSAVQNF